MALLQLTWKEAKHEYHMTNLADWLNKLMTARHELGVAGQTIGDEVFLTMVLDSFDGGKQGQAYGCRADAELVTDFIKLRRGSVHPELDELIDGICERAHETLGTVKGNASKTAVKCQICGKWGHEGKQCPDLKNVELPAHRVGHRPHDRIHGIQAEVCDYCSGKHPGGEEIYYDKKNRSRPAGASYSATGAPAMGMTRRSA